MVRKEIFDLRIAILKFDEENKFKLCSSKNPDEIEINCLKDLREHLENEAADNEAPPIDFDA